MSFGGWPGIQHRPASSTRSSLPGQITLSSSTRLAYTSATSKQLNLLERKLRDFVLRRDPPSDFRLDAFRRQCSPTVLNRIATCKSCSIAAPKRHCTSNQSKQSRPTYVHVRRGAHLPRERSPEHIKQARTECSSSTSRSPKKPNHAQESVGRQILHLTAKSEASQNLH